ncbi:hypothetical protein DVA86_31160 [Streptomyces armeniacus]|uniref:ABC transporter n=1 Tax=Streptomyces armeniacus TaxID=83291 RepID=A0A345XXL5_9ACTN|nr:hypothetical protein [Streptomyces armeniacus]AXK36381.1 hypothetical protein DVA86_31160 [Streptomyces armeniacus]
MRWLTLYARARHVPASLAAVVLSAVAVWALAGDGGRGPGDPRLPVLALAAGAMAASTGLGGHDLALDRTAAIRWAPRRAAHVVLIGTAVCAALLAAQALGEDLATLAFVVRDGAGLAGLAAAGAAVCGARYAWTLPFGWLSFALFAPPPSGVPAQMATWMLVPPGTAAATWTAAVLAAAGTAAYALAGPRR